MTKTQQQTLDALASLHLLRLPCTVVQLADFLGITHQAACMRVKTLRAKGLVTGYQLTPEGVKQADALRAKDPLTPAQTAAAARAWYNESRHLLPMGSTEAWADFLEFCEEDYGAPPATGEQVGNPTLARLLPELSISKSAHRCAGRDIHNRACGKRAYVLDRISGRPWTCVSCRSEVY